MESGKKPSIFSDRGMIGSASELDEYGVWVKSEPEDMTFEDGAFFDEFEESAKTVTEEGGTADFDTGLAATGQEFHMEAVTEEDEAVSETATEDGGGPDYGFDATGQEAPAEPVAEDVAVTDFDVDFGAFEEESPAETAAENGGTNDDYDFDISFDDIPDVPQTGSAEDGGGANDDYDFDISFDDIPDVPQTEIAEDGGGANDDYDFDISFDDIPDVPQTGSAENTGPQQGNDLQNELLFKIANELSTIKSELNDLKIEIATIRDQKMRIASREDAEYADGDEALSYDAPGAVADSAGTVETETSRPDETLPLLDETAFPAILPEEPAAAIQPNETPSLDAPPDEPDTETVDVSFDLDLRDEEMAQDELAEEPAGGLEIPADEATAVPPDEADTETVDASFDLDLRDEGTAQDELAEEPAGILNVPADEAQFLDIPPNDPIAAVPLDETPSLDVPPDEPDTAAIDASVELYLQDEETAQNEPNEDPDSGLEVPAEEITVAAVETPEESGLGQTPVTPDYLSPDELAAVNEAKNSEVPATGAVPETPQPLAEQPEETPPEPPADQAAQKTADDAQDSVIVSAGFKKDLMTVLSYMDKLLEALPDEKIEEFARSEQFDVYKRLFTELGLA